MASVRDIFSAIGGYLFAQSEDLTRRVDFETEKFNLQDKRHLQCLDDNLNDFITKRDALHKFDKVAFAAAAGVTALLGIGLFGRYLSATAYAAIFVLAKTKYGRDKLSLEYDQALDELFKTYVWYSKDQTPIVTFQPKFLEMLEALLPCTKDYRKLLLWDISKNPQEISDKFLKLFAESPHHVVFVLDKHPETTKQQAPVPSALESYSNLVLPVVNIKLSDIPYLGFFSGATQVMARTADDAKMNLLYGHDFEAKTEPPKLR